ncbi:MAG TPA: RES domain-containing protein [Rhizomicrobium sp.]|nr:RES domain-containing protein [Rhizomicrobium sp.]
MTAQILDRTLKAYRIGDPNGAYPIFDATGSVKAPGRWNTASSPMIYASEHYSTTMLEKLVHGSGDLPPDQHFVEITIPVGISYEMLNEAEVPDWYSEAAASSKAFGETWQQAKRSLILIVPSVVARPESNILINPEHPEFPKITTSLHKPVWWDKRLFAA